MKYQIMEIFIKFFFFGIQIINQIQKALIYTRGIHRELEREGRVPYLSPAVGFYRLVISLLKILNKNLRFKSIFKLFYIPYVQRLKIAICMET